jgi:hypothetical protein
VLHDVRNEEVSEDVRDGQIVAEPEIDQKSQKCLVSRATEIARFLQGPIRGCY